MPRVIVALNEPEGNRDFIAYSKNVLHCLGDTSLFPSPTPPLTVVEADVGALDVAEVATLRQKGVASARDASRQVVRRQLDLLRGYVQTLADALPVAEAAELVARSGFSVKASSGHGKPPFEAKDGPTSGSVHLVARAEKTRASYQWQFSKDGTTWTSLEDTVRADAWVHGLEPAVAYFFRYSTTTKAGRSDWSEVISLVVL